MLRVASHVGAIRSRQLSRIAQSQGLRTAPKRRLLRPIRGARATIMEEEQASLRGKGKAQGGGGGGDRKGGRGKGSGGGLPRDVAISKALSRLLRHQAENAGIKLDKEGYATVDRVMQYGPLRSLKVTLDDIKQAVAGSEKQRFGLKPNPATNPMGDEDLPDPSHWLIRANQGHSIQLESEALLRPITLEAGNVPDVVVHGTYYAFWPLVLESGGLKRMSRNHVHFGTGLPEDAAAGVISGMRKDAELLVYVDVRRSLEDGGIRWWMSENGVVLTEGDADGLVPAKYFKEVVGHKEDVGLLFKDGEKVADLPPTIKARIPRGKGGRGGGRAGRGGR